MMRHQECDHENTSYERWKCRAPKRHAGCGHRQDVTGWKRCERIEKAATETGTTTKQDREN